MNALVGVRSNATGLMTPTPDERAAVKQQLVETAAARAGVMAPATRSESTGAPDTTDTNTFAGAAQQELGKDVFLQLLVMQMQHQDPLNPMDNSDMVAQLAQFSALEAQTKLNDKFEQLSGNVDQLNFISASQLLGKTVTGVDLNGNLQTGVVESVHLDGSVVMLSVGGELMSMAGILGIETAVDGGDAAAGSQTGTASASPAR